MKNNPVSAHAAHDIHEQVAKVLRALGNPQPPLNLDSVRELLNLDRRFYSTTNTSYLQEFASRLKVGAKEAVIRLADAFLKWDIRGFFLPEKRLILINGDLKPVRQRWPEGHEIAHSLLPWHQRFMFGDNRETLRISCHEKLEREANLGCAELCFMQGRFSQEGCDSNRDFASVKALSKTFGNSMTSTLWRFVEEAHRDEPIFGVISAHPHYPGQDFDSSEPCRYFIESPAFRKQFGNVSESQVFEAIKEYAKWTKGGPLGEADVDFAGRDGSSHRFHLETFFNRTDALTLGVYVGPVNHQIVVP